MEDDSKQQPLQFSFTLYDLDGHGKITKDDIAGIVSTIYESIGKSVVVPHYGSKTINVRLTVSPDSKTRSHINSSYCNNNKKNEDVPRRDVAHENCSQMTTKRRTIVATHQEMGVKIPKYQRRNETRTDYQKTVQPQLLQQLPQTQPMKTAS